MSTSDLDLPLLPSAEQIRRREFATIRRGYDPDQVRDYLTAVAAQVENLEKDLREMRLGKASEPAPVVEAPQPAPEPAPVVDPYEELGKRFAGLIETADAEAKQILDEAKAEAARMLEEARTETDQIRVDAQSRAEEARQAGNEALEKAKLEAQRMLTGLAARRENLVVQLQQMQTKLRTVAQDLEVTIDEPLDLESAEPEAPTERPAEGQPDKPEDGSPKEESRDESRDESSNGSGKDANAKDQSKAEQEDADAKARSSAPADYVVDPRYDDLWVSTETVDLPELASIELDFDEETPDKTE